MNNQYASDARVYKALGDENRLRILELLKAGEKCGCVLLSELNISQPTLSHHMKILCDAGIVDALKKGKLICYSIAPEGQEKIKKICCKYMK